MEKQTLQSYVLDYNVKKTLISWNNIKYRLQSLKWLALSLLVEVLSHLKTAILQYLPLMLTKEYYDSGVSCNIFSSCQFIVSNSVFVYSAPTRELYLSHNSTNKMSLLKTDVKKKKWIKEWEDGQRKKINIVYNNVVIV